MKTHLLSSFVHFLGGGDVRDFLIEIPSSCCLHSWNPIAKFEMACSQLLDLVRANNDLLCSFVVSEIVVTHLPK